MFKEKRVHNTFISLPHKDNYIWNEENQIIVYTSYSKALLGGDFVERYGLSSYSSPN